MKRSLIAVAVTAAALTVTATAGAAASSTPPAGMTSTCTVARNGLTVTESGVLSYADGSAAGGWTVNVLWHDYKLFYWATPDGVVTGGDGSWSETFTVNLHAATQTTVSVVYTTGSKVRREQVATCNI